MIYKDIQEQFNQVVAYSQGIPDPQTDELFDRWLEAKRSFIEAFDGKLIYEVPETVCFTLDAADKQNRLDEFINSLWSVYSNEDLAEFVAENSEGFFDNKVLKEWTTSEGIIPTGMKLVKAFKFFEKDKATLEMLQNKASQVIQEDKIEGKLCFSVHPLDYLSSSENTYNWRSCHALDGEYRAGNLSYMVDKATVICYLKGADNVHIPMFPESVLWNSKKWRMLMFMSNNWDMMFAGRQYPFSSEPGIQKVLTEFIKAIGQDDRKESCYPMWSPWSQIYADDTILPIVEKWIPIRGTLHKLTDIVSDTEEEPLHYNDLLHSTCYHKPYYAIKYNYAWYRWDMSTPVVTIGGPVRCLHCGKQHITNPETMRCNDCEFKYGHEENDIYGYCSVCGARIFVEDAVIINGEYVCEQCCETECFTCQDCGGIYFNSDKRYDQTLHKHVCKWCLRDSKSETGNASIKVVDSFEDTDSYNLDLERLWVYRPQATISIELNESKGEEKKWLKELLLKKQS